MASDFERLGDRQRDVARALEQVVAGLRRTDSAGLSASLVSRRPEAAESGGAPPSSSRGGLSETVEEALAASTRATRGLASEIGANTQAVEGQTAALGGRLNDLLQGFGSGLTKGGGGFGSFLKSGLGLIPLGLKLGGLFGGKDEEEQRRAAYTPPPSLELEAANADRVLGGFPRSVRDASGGVRSMPAATAPAPQITVQIQALDSRSILDRSDDIARAMRDAMLHMHPVNDVIGEI